MTTLYKQDAKGTVRIWQIKPVVMGYEVIYGQMGGGMTEKTHPVLEGKVNRTIYEQIELQINSKIKQKIDTGYSKNIEDANTKSVNALGFLKPMLAKKMEDCVLPSQYFLQYKYDGNRCIITKQYGEVIAYTRSGQKIDSVGHITEACKDIPEGVYLDGELYHHGTPLQTLRSWISREQDSSRLLNYILYDTVSPNSFVERIRELKEYTFGFGVVRAPTTLITAHSAGESTKDRLDTAIALGYEGLIARVGDKGYEDGKRSNSLIKIKRWLDDEFKIIDISASVDGLAILHCVTRSGSIFRVTAPGTNYAKREILEQKGKYIGQYVTVQFANMTKDKIPFHPVAIDFYHSIIS